jgi:hypothetical protein
VYDIRVVIVHELKSPRNTELSNTASLRPKIRDPASARMAARRMTRGRERTHEGLALESARKLSDRGPRRYPKLRLRTITRNSSSITTPRSASPLTGSRSANEPPFRHSGSWRRENLPVPIVHHPEALRPDLSVPSRTRWRPCESARPSKSPGRSADHPENRSALMTL